MKGIGFDELMRRRLVFVVGKGGVGRTTVTVGLALEAARRGQRVLAIELEGARGLEAALAEQRHSSRPPPGLDRIEHMVVDGKRALEEYLSLIIPVRRLLKTVFSSSVYQYFVAAAPGLKELMTIGKLWYEADKRNPEGGAGPDEAPEVVLVDGPATGHSLQYLRMPQAALDAFSTGLVHREAERIVGLLRDPEATAVVMVSTAEEMPANETCDICRGLDELGLLAALLVVNQVHREPCSEGELDALRKTLAGAASRRRGVARRKVSDPERLWAEVVARAVEEQGWAAVNAFHLARLAKSVPVPTVELSYVFDEEFGAEHVAALGRELVQQLEPAATPARATRGARAR